VRNLRHNGPGDFEEAAHLSSATSWRWMTGVSPLP
jgi:hypothetical protein